MNWRDLPSLSALRAFEAAARLGSFSAAARELNVTHAAIAQHVRALEDHFACPLVERRGRAMAATPDGHALAAALADGFGSIAAACRDLADRDRVRPLRIAVTPSFAANWLMPRIGGFWAAHPEIEVEILPGEGIVDLRADQIDVAIRYGRGGWPGVEDRILVRANHVAVAAPGRLDGAKVTRLADLKGQTWLFDSTRSEEVLWAQMNGVEVETERAQYFATTQLVREAVRAGLGIAILPAPLVDGDIAAGQLIELCREADSPVAYHVLTRPGHVSARRDAFVKWLNREAAPLKNRRDTDVIPTSRTVR